MIQKGLLDIFCLAMLWGPSFLFIKIAMRDLAPLTIVTLRIGLGGLFLFIVLKLKKIALPRDKRLWKHGFILGLFANSFPFICFSFAVLYIPTSLSALINGTTPVLTVLLANAFIEDERLTWNRTVGVLIGLSGFMVLFLPKLMGFDAEFDSLGMFLSFLAAASYAIGIVYARLHVQKSPPLVIPTLQLLTSLLYLIPLAFIFEAPSDVFDASISTWGAILGLSVLGTMLAYIMYYRIINKYGATALSMVTYLLPILGTLLGVIFLEETITPPFYIATIFIMMGVMVMNGLIPTTFLRRK